jgi:hypothetical protein
MRYTSLSPATEERESTGLGTPRECYNLYGNYTDWHNWIGL